MSSTVPPAPSAVNVANVEAARRRRARMQEEERRSKLARQLVNEKRELLPVSGADGKLIGAMERQRALDILLGEGT